MYFIKKNSKIQKLYFQNAILIQFNNNNNNVTVTAIKMAIW